MLTHNDLMERRTRTVAAMRALDDDPKGTGGDLDETQSQRFDELRTELTGLDQRIERRRLIDDADRRAPARTVSGRDSFEVRAKEFRISRAIAGHMDKHIDTGLEDEVSQELVRRSGKSAEGIMVPFDALVPERRALAYSGDGSNLVGVTNLGGRFEDALRERAVVGRLGAETITGVVGDIAFPRMDARTPAAEWIDGDGGALTGGDASVESVTASPKTVGLLTEITRRVAIQSNPAAERILRNHIMSEMALAIDKAALTGSGSGNEPRDCPILCVSVICSMLCERSKDDDDFQRRTGRTSERLRAA